MHPVREERVPQSLRRRETLIGIERQATLEEIDKVVQLSGLCIVEATRGGQQAGAQIPSLLDYSQRPDDGLQRQVSHLPHMRLCIIGRREDAMKKSEAFERQPRGTMQW